MLAKRKNEKDMVNRFALETMDSIDLLMLHDDVPHGGVARPNLPRFNGPLSRGVIEAVANALRGRLRDEHVEPSTAMDVFGAYIEMAENIRHYAAAHGYDGHEASAMVVVANQDDGRHVVATSNVVEAADGRALVDRVHSLARLDKAQLKACYKAQLRRARPGQPGCGMGLGLIDIARKASEPLAASLRELGTGRSLFSLRAVI